MTCKVGTCSVNPIFDTRTYNMPLVSVKCHFPLLLISHQDQLSKGCLEMNKTKNKTKIGRPGLADDVITTVIGCCLDTVRQQGKHASQVVLSRLA